MTCEHKRTKRTIERNAGGEVWDDTRCLDCGRPVRPPTPTERVMRAAERLAEELARIYRGPSHPQMSPREQELVDAVSAWRAEPPKEGG